MRHKHKFIYHDKDKLYYYYRCACGCRKTVERSLVDVNPMRLTTISWQAWSGRLMK